MALLTRVYNLAVAEVMSLERVLTLAAQVGELLKQRGETIAVVEPRVAVCCRRRCSRSRAPRPTTWAAR